MMESLRGPLWTQGMDQRSAPTELGALGQMAVGRGAGRRHAATVTASCGGAGSHLCLVALVLAASSLGHQSPQGILGH